MSMKTLPKSRWFISIETFSCVTAPIKLSARGVGAPFDYSSSDHAAYCLLMIAAVFGECSANSIFASLMIKLGLLSKSSSICMYLNDVPVGSGFGAIYSS